MESSKKLHTIVDFSFRKIIEEANKQEVSKDEIVTIQEYADQIYLIYYR